MTIRDVLQDLNPEQRKAVQTTEGPLLILAGAGSGKTRVLTRRIAYLVQQGVPPWQILAVTFTNKAAAEMKARVAELVGPMASRILVSTFHSACVRFLRQDIDRLGYRSTFTIYDDDDQVRLIKQLCRARGIDAKAYPPRKLRSHIDRAKNQMQGPDGLAEERRWLLGDPTVDIYRAYQEHLRSANAVDFNDLVNLVVELWSRHPDVLARYQQRFPYLLVDEYQDTNRAQYHLVRHLGSGSRNVAVVGDDDQSIYSFRGADVRNILDFEKDFPEAMVIRLEQNYRSTGNILKAAGAVVRHNTRRMDKELWTEAEAGEPITMIVAQDELDEASQVLDQVRILRRGELDYGDMAIIYRTNATSRVFEQVLSRFRIPHVLVGARKFYERREIRDVLAYLKLSLNPADDIAFLRVVNVPSRGIGAKALDGIRRQAVADGVPLLSAARTWSTGKGRGRKGAATFCELLERFQGAVATLSPGELVAAVVDETGYGGALRQEGTPEAQGRLENLAELSRAVEQEQQGAWEAVDGPADDPAQRLQRFLDQVCLSSGQDDLLDDEGGRVTLLTAHLAKGLEFPVVFVVGMSEGGFPHFLALDTDEELEEERRLVYVAFTRAMERLFLSRPRRRLVMGQGYRDAGPSRFLQELPGDLLEFSSRGGGRGQSARFGTASPTPWTGARTVRRPMSASTDSPRDTESIRTLAPDDASAFSEGTQVVHPTFGHGIVRKREGAPNNPKLHIHFDNHGRKMIYARFAKLEIVVS